MAKNLALYAALALVALIVVAAAVYAAEKGRPSGGHGGGVCGAAYADGVGSCCKTPGPSYYHRKEQACTHPCTYGGGPDGCCLVPDGKGGKKDVVCPATNCCDEAQPFDSPCDRCEGVVCPPGQECDSASGKCEEPQAVGVEIHNHCPNKDMVVRYAALRGGPLPGLAKLPAGGQVSGKIPTPSVSGRIYFYPDNAQIDTKDTGETAYSWLEYNNDEAGLFGSNLTYVDHIALPMSYRLSGGDCTGADGLGCTTPLATLDIEGRCPPGLLTTSPSGVAMCLSPRTYCDGLPNFGVGSGDPRCDSAVPGVAADLMAQLHACCEAGVCEGAECAFAPPPPPTAGAGGAAAGPAAVRPHDIWACEGPFKDDSPRCAMFQRGLFAPGTGKKFADIDQAYLAEGCKASNLGLYECEPGNFYSCAPYNDYCKWLQGAEGCPGIYCQPYDDQGGQGGFRSCHAKSLRIDLCAGDKPEKH
jgi:hypothetical protein